jgi:hypothetical protein
MRQFAVFLDNAVKGPLTEYEIQDLIHSGQVTPETPCAPVGTEQWEPLSQHFTFGSGLKLARRQAETTEGEEAVPDTPRLDTDLRRRLLSYGIANATTVDEISPAQAAVLIAQTEARIRAQIKLRRIAAVALLGVGIAGGHAVLGNDVVIQTLGVVADTAAIDDPATIKRWNRVLDEARRHEKLAVEALNAPFPPPTGGTESLPILLSRLKVNEAKAYQLSTTIRPSPEKLVAPLESLGINLGDKVAVAVFAEDIPAAQLLAAQAQAETLALILSPVSDEGQYARLLEATMNTFPDSPSIPESGKLRKELASIKINELGVAIERTLARAEESQRLAAGKSPNVAGEKEDPHAAWARELRQFALRITLLRDRIRISINPDARRDVWSEFNRGPGAELTAWALANATRTIETGEEGGLKVEEGPDLRGDVLARRFLVRLRIQEDTVLLPWDSPFLVVGESETQRIPNSVFLEREAYRVVSKVMTGGRRHFHRGDVAGRSLIIGRESPHWYYISVARDNDSDVLTLRVDESLYQSLSSGNTVPVATLAKYPVHAKPAESNPAQGLLVDP